MNTTKKRSFHCIKRMTKSWYIYVNIYVNIYINIFARITELNEAFSRLSVQNNRYILHVSQRELFQSKKRNIMLFSRWCSSVKIAPDGTSDISILNQYTQCSHVPIFSLHAGLYIILYEINLWKFLRTLSPDSLTSYLTNTLLNVPFAYSWKLWNQTFVTSICIWTC